MKVKYNLKIKIIFTTALIALILIIGFWVVKQTVAYTGPSATVGDNAGFGALRFDVTNGVLGIGQGVTTNPNVTLVIKGKTNGAGQYGLVVQNSDNNPAIEIRDDGVVIIGGVTPVGSYVVNASSVFSNFADFTELRTNQSYVDNFIDGQGTADIINFASIEGVTINADVNADYVSAGVFGELTVSGTYAFPFSLGVNTTSILEQQEDFNVQGDAYVSRFLGIGKIPSVSLDIAGDGTANGRVNIRYSPTEATYGQIYGDTNGVVLSARNASANYGLHFYTSNADSEVEQMRITTAGVGIGVFPPTAKLDVAGTVKTTGFQLTTGAQSGYVLKSDGSGVASWAAASALPAGSNGQTIRHDGVNWAASSLLYNNGTSVGVGTTSIDADTLLKVGEGGYLQFSKVWSGAPSGDCSSPSHTGRVTLDITNNFLYICNGSAWKGVKLTN